MDVRIDSVEKYVHDVVCSYLVPVFQCGVH